MQNAQKWDVDRAVTTNDEARRESESLQLYKPVNLQVVSFVSPDKDFDKDSRDLSKKMGNYFNQSLHSHQREAVYSIISRETESVYHVEV